MSRVVPTPRFWWMVGLGLPLALAGSVVPGAERLLWIYNTLLLATLYFTARLALRRPPILADRLVDPVLSVRQPNPVRIDIENLTESKLSLRLRDEIPDDCQADHDEFRVDLPGGASRQLVYTLTPRTRGPAEFGRLCARIVAPLGLATVDWFFNPGTNVRVFPNVKAVRDFELLKNRGHLSMAGLRRSPRRGLGTEFESLRDYNEDDMRFVDWKSTARRGRLVVKNFEQERNQAVIVCFDAGRHMLGEVQGTQKIDHCLDAALMLLHSAERAGDQVGLMVFSDKVIKYLAPKRGRAQVAALLEAVHAVQPEPVQPDYVSAFAYLAARWKRRSLVVVFTDAENEDQARELAEALGHIRRHHKLLVVRVGDPRLRELLTGSLVDEHALYARAAATWYQSDRRRADATLSQARMESVESEPQDLATTLVSRYLKLKERAAL